MSYDDSRFRGEPGFRDEPDFRSRTDTSDTSPLGNGSGSLYNPGSYPVTGYASNGTETDDVVTTRRTPSPAQLEDVFDDPAHGDPGRDRMMVHILWEVLLLLATAGVAVLLYRGHRATVTGAGLRDLEVSAAILGFLALGAGLSLRAAVPNLALGPVAYASALFFAQHADRGLLTTAVVTGLLAVAAGAVLARTRRPGTRCTGSARSRCWRSSAGCSGCPRRYAARSAGSAPSPIRPAAGVPARGFWPRSRSSGRPRWPASPVC